MSLPLPAPEPPPNLHRRKLVIEELPAGTPIYRFHTAKYPPTFFDTSQSSRFNSPDGSYGVMYAALERHGAFAETFLRDVGSTAISELFVESKACATYTLTSAIRAIRLRGYGLAPIGATASVCSRALVPPIPCRKLGRLHFTITPKNPMPFFMALGTTTKRCAWRYSIAPAMHSISRSASRTCWIRPGSTS
jgi:hypothetical protein